MKPKTKVVLLAVMVLSMLFLPKNAVASGYTRYVAPAPDGGTLFIFTNGSPGLNLIMRYFYGFDTYPWDLLKPVPPVRPTPVPVYPKPVPKPSPTPEHKLPIPDPEPQVPIPETPPEQEENLPVSGLTAMEQGMVDLVNQEREAAGLLPLKVDMRLVELARKKSQDMIDQGYFSHTSPTYGSPFDMMRAAGITYITAGENLAGAPTLGSAHKGLMDSDGHRKNILNSAFDHVGIGVVKGGAYGYMFTQMFTGQ